MFLYYVTLLYIDHEITRIHYRVYMVSNHLKDETLLSTRSYSDSERDSCVKVQEPSMVTVLQSNSYTD